MTLAWPVIPTIRKYLNTFRFSPSPTTPKKQQKCEKLNFVSIRKINMCIGFLYDINKKNTSYGTDLIK